MPLSAEDAKLRLSKIKPHLASRFGITRIGVFGSVSRNEANAGSDLDLLMTYSHPLSLSEHLDLRDFLMQQFQVYIDVVDANRIHPYLRSSIEEDVQYV